MNSERISNIITELRDGILVSGQMLYFGRTFKMDLPPYPSRYIFLNRSKDYTFESLDGLMRFNDRMICYPPMHIMMRQSSSRSKPLYSVRKLEKKLQDEAYMNEDISPYVINLQTGFLYDLDLLLISHMGYKVFLVMIHDNIKLIEYTNRVLH